MANTLTETGFSQLAFEAFLDDRNEPSWLTARRRAAWSNFLEMSWPARNAEEWIRTDIRLFNVDKYDLPIGENVIDGHTATIEDTPPGLLTAGVSLGGYAASLNGRSVASHVESKWTDKGVIFGSLEKLVSEHSDLVEKYLLTKAVNPEFDRFSALHSACWSAGGFLFVPRGVAVDQPFHVLSAMTDGGSDFGHILVILEDGAEATLLTETVSPHGQSGGLHCGATELFVGKNAHLRFVSLQDWGNKVWHFAHQNAQVDSDATLQWTLGGLGSRLSKVNQHVALVGERAESQVNGALFTEGKQHLSYHTLQHHKAANCQSDFLYKAALQDKSRTVWRGMIKVDAAAQKTDGYQRNDNLLLSDNARADSIPGLEIEADDVRCTHGSTTGQVNDEMIFYAQCRGFTRQEAIRMIVTGFFQQIFDRITIESVRDALGLAIARRVRDYE